MNEKLSILQCLIENRAFAPSHSALAGTLGYKGKMTVYRLMNGQIREGTVEEVWNRITACFHLSETDLYHIAAIFEGAKELADLVFPEMNHNHPEWVKYLVLALVRDSYDYFSEKFRREVAPVLKDVRKDEPDVFWGIVAMLYMRGLAIDVYRGDVAKQAIRVMQELAGWLHEWFPEKFIAHEAAANLLHLSVVHNLWSLLYNCIIIFRYYTEATYITQAAQCMQLFPWGKRSYWRAPGSSYQPGCEVWLLVQQDLGRATNGFYIVMRLETGKDIRTFTLKDAITFFFLTVDREDELPVLQARNTGEGPEICYYLYDYDEESRELHLEADPDTGNLFDIPGIMQMINLEHPVGKNEKVWARILKDLDEGQGRSIFQQAKERLSGRVELKEDYRLTDIRVSKTYCTLFIERQGLPTCYQLPLDAYDFLSEINPSQRVMLFKRMDDNEVYVGWPDFGCEIRLSEFTEIKE